jgi:hypothetical protein
LVQRRSHSSGSNGETIAAASIARGSPGQNRCAFAVELLGAWPYPEDQALAMAAALEQTTGVLANA